jgi:hypothetical protein
LHLVGQLLTYIHDARTLEHKQNIIFIVAMFVGCYFYAAYLKLHIKSLVSKVYSIAAILWLQFMVHVMLFIIINVVYFYVSTLRSMYTVPSVVLSGYVVQVFSEWFWGTSWTILRLFQLPPLLLISLLFLYFFIF